MGYTTVIAEKPSVAATIAKVLGAHQRHAEKTSGYYEGNGYRVTWAFGHLVGLDSPEDMGFGGGVLPIMPEEWKTHVLERPNDPGDGVKKQMKVLETLFKGADEIIVATDAGREGELIFRYIYEHIGCKTPFRRFWNASLTDEGIRKGFANLKSGDDYAPLSAAAHARSEADWLVGYNASRALRLATGYRGNLSLGRVQTPVLSMICERTEAFNNFTPTPFWQISALTGKNGQAFTALSKEHYKSEEEGMKTLAAVKAAGTLTVKTVEKKPSKSSPPLLFDLTSLQQIANRRHKFTADKTLKIAQSLYEKKFLTYPRTGSQYISEDVFKTIPALISRIAASYGEPKYADAARSLEGKKLCRRSVDDAKLTDHHALLPTEVIPTSLDGDEKIIWEMVARRTLEAFGEDCLGERTTVILDCAGVEFRAGGSVITKEGWKGMFGADPAEEETEPKKKKGGKDADDAEECQNERLPALSEGETLKGEKFECLRKTDKPLPLYDDNSLLGDMKTCGKHLDDEELRSSLKDIGLGTTATRAATIEILIKRAYIERNAKGKILPTGLGVEIWKAVRGRSIADVKTSGQWEHDLALVEQGKMTKRQFDEGIRRFTLEIIDDLQKNCRPIDGSVSMSSRPVSACPCCGKPMKNMKFSIFCDPQAQGCGFKIPLEVAGKKLPESALKALAAGKPTAVIKGFKSKSGKSFEAKLVPDVKEKKISFAFEDRLPPAGPVTEGRICPCCNGPLSDDKWKLTCPKCSFTLYKTQCGVTMNEAQIDTLLKGERINLKGMTSKAGKKFDAGLVVNRSAKKVDFVFEPRKK